MNEETNTVPLVMYKIIITVIGITLGCICGLECYKELCDNDDNIL